MKKIFLYLTFSTVILSFQSLTICSEKNWFQKKLDGFSHKMITRHTYEHNSFEHIRDRAVLFMLPSSTAQGVLMLQRSNMKKFLKQNEENARGELLKFFQIDEKTSLMIKEQIHKSQQCCLQAMKSCHNVMHDTTLPPAWIRIIKERCEKKGININSLNLTASYAEPTFFAQVNNCSSFDENNYDPVTIELNINTWNEFQNKYGNFEDEEDTLRMAIDHELTHVIENHQAQWDIILKYTDFGKMMKSLHLESMSTSTIFDSLYFLNWISAKEKTADTLLMCTDPEIAKNSITAVCKSAYRDNYNDINVICANWQTSQAITNFQQLKSSIKQKLTAFPKFVA